MYKIKYMCANINVVKIYNNFTKNLKKRRKVSYILFALVSTRYEGDRVKKEIAEKTLALQRISTERLKRRGKDLYYWMKELERMILVSPTRH